MKAKRYISMMIAMISAVVAHADTQAWYETSRVLWAGTTVIDSVADGAETVHIHLRASAPKWALEWNRRSASDLWRATIEVTRDDSDVYSPQAHVTVERIADGVTEVLSDAVYTNGFDYYDGDNSLVYVYDGVSARLYGGDGEQLEICRVPVTRQGGAVTVSAPTEVKCRRISVESGDPRAPRVFSANADAGALQRALLASRDPNAGVWEYLDREMDASKAAMSTSLQIATVPDGGGGYTIVYLGGETIGRFDRPMLVKGRLKPTIFKDEYDMEWVSADGTLLREDVSATFSDDNAILTLRFPLLGTKVRLRRKPIR